MIVRVKEATRILVRVPTRVSVRVRAGRSIVPGAKGEQGDPGESVGGVPVYVQDVLPPDAGPYVWWETADGALRTLWVNVPA